MAASPIHQTRFNSVARPADSKRFRVGQTTSHGTPSARTMLPCVAALSLLLAACDVGTEPENQLTARLSVAPDVLQSPSVRQLPTTPTVVVGVTNNSDRDVVIGGTYACFLSFEVLDSTGTVVMDSPAVSRVCTAGIGELPLAPGEQYEETMGWIAYEYRDRKWRSVLPNGRYGLRAVLGVMEHGRVSLPPVVAVRIAMDST